MFNFDTGKKDSIQNHIKWRKINIQVFQDKEKLIPQMYDSPQICVALIANYTQKKSDLTQPRFHILPLSAVLPSTWKVSLNIQRSSKCVQFNK